MSAPKFVIIGRLGRTRGVHGDIWVTPDTDFPERFLELTEVYVQNRDTWECMKLAATSIISGRPVLRFENITSPEEVARLTNRKLAVRGNEVVALPEGSYYLFDLVDCQVIDENTGDVIGTIVAVEMYPANDVYVLNDAEGNELLLPAIRKYVKVVLIDEKKIVIDTAGLLTTDEEEPD